MKTILVTGGSGFLGSHICHAAAMAGIPVTSISRSANPRSLAEIHPAISWNKADIFNPPAWRRHLKNCLAVVHCIGLLNEEKSKGITHERVIWESARIAADEAEAAGVKKFVLISSAGGPPGVPDTYVHFKRKAEAYLEQKSFAHAILRPGMLYGGSRPESIRLKKKMNMLLHVPVIGRKIKPVRPLDVAQVAQTALLAAVNDEINGLLTIDDIERLYQANYA